MKTININADLGEGATNDSEIMPLISSCNIACGGHAGNITTMTETVGLALQHKVKIGAHPSFPDPENFGRVKMEISEEALQRSIQEQLKTLQSVVEKQGHRLHHVKPHGALYNEAAKERVLADRVLTSIKEICGKILMYVPPNSQLQKAAIALEMPTAIEAFIDRQYEDDGSLVSRQKIGALITDKVKAWQQLEDMVLLHQVATRRGKKISITPETYCIHGDQENAVEILQYIHQKAKTQNIRTL